MNSSPTRPRWIGIALLLAAVGFLAIEAFVASAWHARPYSYADDYVNFLGSPYAGSFQGYAISSPLWLLMDIGWVTSGALIATASARLVSSIGGWRRTLVIVLGAALALALVIFAAVPLTPATMAAGLLPLYLSGAFLSIIAGNALAITIGLLRRRLGLPRWSSVTGIALGAVGLVSIPVTYGWLAIGIAERIPMYSFLAWAAITGVALIGQRQRARR